jgi:hypothetical protein
MLTICNAIHDWGFRSSDMWCCVTRQVAPTVSKDCSAFPPLKEGNGTMIPQTVGNRSPKYTPTYLRITESCEDVKSCTDMRHSRQSAVMWPVTPSVCASLPNASIHPKLPQSECSGADSYGISAWVMHSTQETQTQSSHISCQCYWNVCKST